MKHDSVTPYNTQDEKKEQVALMFDNIAKRYDLLNSILSLGIHRGWRKRCVKLLKDKQPKKILDVATGTGDFAIECAKLNPESIIGIDISDGMMKYGREKLKVLKLDSIISLKNGNAETIFFPDNSFDAIVVGFGVRNFQNLNAGLSNLHRMLKPGGQLVVLEFSYPRNAFIKGFYNFYFSKVTPFIGKIFSKDTRAYTYLTESVKAFPHNEKFIEILNSLKYKNTSFELVSFGIAAIYSGEK
ncbi:bifunctional demethylmenaquinone methyltransferase/2-methoxy-6-polyprenyl-1,4-benzoquinol methylase UbiE [Aurantibacillus circumpalustris]|uniref:bifunctional demethylmenaquinone methyltransferase/2-methoxy-6-polyprenyl-1,4-benzoquinol methylase UbiE n=1 Tax=Aurantibacillus circumpalustris TaxID=3036359 RepID=UPI00295BAB21|nr:bifunctional demethylmenaquinone methyltransferase/2-methoxy-6-polyprenyl-1,4-benzoquinol methylase UbiE [Aurantibacillus circumpalustris]